MKANFRNQQKQRNVHNYLDLWSNYEVYLCISLPQQLDGNQVQLEKQM